MKNMAKKKSSGLDGISQKNLILGAEVLAIPLARIINKSIETGVVPQIWKEAVVTPIYTHFISFHQKLQSPSTSLQLSSWLHLTQQFIQ